MARPLDGRTFGVARWIARRDGGRACSHTCVRVRPYVGRSDSPATQGAPVALVSRYADTPPPPADIGAARCRHSASAERGADAPRADVQRGVERPPAPAHGAGRGVGGARVPARAAA